MSQAGDNDDNSILDEPSSRISFEVDPGVILEEIDRLVDDTSDDESEGDCDDGAELLDYHKNIGSNLNDEVNHNPIRSFEKATRRFTSDSHHVSATEEKEIQPDTPSHRPPRRRRGSLLAAVENQIINKAVEAGKIVCTRTMGPSRSRRHSIHCFTRRASIYNLDSERRRSVDVCAVDYAMRRASLSAAAPKQKDSDHHHPEKAEPRRDSLTLESVMDSLKDFHQNLTDELIHQKDKNSSQLTLDTAMSEPEYSEVPL